MSNNDDKKDSKTGDRKSSGPTPVKRSRKRQASRPPTINVEAVHVEAEKAESKAAQSKPKPTKSDSTDKAKPDTAKQPQSKTEAKTAGVKPDSFGLKDISEHFGYRELALSAVTGAAVSIVLFTGIFGVSFFTSDNKDIESEIADLTRQVSTLKVLADNPPASQANKDAIKALRQQVEDLSNRPRDTQVEQVNEVIKSLKDSIAKLQKNPVDSAALTKLAARLNTLENKTTKALSSAEISIQRATQLEEAVKAAGETIRGSTDGTQGSIAAQNLRLAGIEAQVKRLSDTITNLEKKVSKNAKMAVIEKDLAQLKEGLSSIDRSLSSLDQKTSLRLSKLEQNNITEDISRLTALSFAIENLVRAVEAGGPFERELNTVTDALKQNEKLGELQDIAKTGIRSVASLQEDFKPVLRAILAAEDNDTAPGVVGSLVGTAKSLIRIRRVGEIEGDSREAIIARLEARVKAGDLAAALISAKKLKGASAKAAEGWVKVVEKRLMTIKLIKSIRNEVITNLGSN